MFAINQLRAFNQLRALCPSKRPLVLLPWLVSVMVSLPVQAEKVYTWTDENGNRVYSDSPREGAETVKLKPIMRMEFPEPRASNTTPPIETLAPIAASYSGLSWITPTPSQTFPVGVAGNVAVAVQSTPNLQSGDQIEIFVNGAKVSTFSSGAGTLQNLPRGEHQLVAKIVSNGKVVSETAAITIFVQRAKVGG